MGSAAEAAAAEEEAASATGRPYLLLLRHARPARLPAGPAEDWPREAGSWSGRPSAAAGGTGGTATATATAEADLKGGTTAAGGRPRRRRTGRGIATETEETREGDVQIVTTVSLIYCDTGYSRIP